MFREVPWYLSRRRCRLDNGEITSLRSARSLGSRGSDVLLGKLYYRDRGQRPKLPSSCWSHRCALDVNILKDAHRNTIFVRDVSSLWLARLGANGLVIDGFCAPTCAWSIEALATVWLLFGLLSRLKVHAIEVLTNQSSLRGRTKAFLNKTINRSVAGVRMSNRELEISNGVQAEPASQRKQK
jgi:hypothetical protein